VVAVNRDKVDSWKVDVARSVDFYNEWFMAFAPQAFRETRIEITKQVELALQLTKNLTNIRPETLLANPAVLPMLRMATCPPIARDRLIGLAGVSPNLVKIWRMNSGHRSLWPIDFVVLSLTRLFGMFKKNDNLQQLGLD
jgi:XamI restriction endonuclease